MAPRFQYPVLENPGNADYEDLDRLGKCVEGRHTTCVKAARYDSNSFLSCKLEGGKCVTDFIEGDDDEPIFN